MQRTKLGLRDGDAEGDWVHDGEPNSSRRRAYNRTVPRITSPLVILTGMSGAGKSTALRCLEDLGYFCIDNLPPTLIGIFLKLYQQTPHHQPGVAIVSDIRSGELFEHFGDVVRQLDTDQVKYELVFIDCQDAELQHRFHATRRRPPLGEQMGLEEALTAERERLRPVEALATFRIDTTQLSPEQLRERMLGVFSDPGPEGLLTLTLLSFGFKYGTPGDADFVFDARFLPNPYYVDELRDLAGTDVPVSEYIMRAPAASELLEQMEQILRTALRGYPDIRKYSVLAGIGCTGGRHRSVCLAVGLAARLRRSGFRVNVQHRDVQLPQ
jgi:UPF0042 nucleotide-binding protein